MTQLTGVFLTSTGLVAASEMGDKTQLLAFVLAARFKRPLPLLLGILAATLLNHGLAAWVGGWISTQVPQSVLKAVLGLGFLGFALWTLKPDDLDQAETGSKAGMGAFMTTLSLFFMAEMGDKTQLATVGLAARFAPNVMLVTAGTTLGMMIADGLAVIAGHQLGDKLPMNWIRRTAALLFACFGVAILLY